MNEWVNIPLKTKEAQTMVLPFKLEVSTSFCNVKINANTRKSCKTTDVKTIKTPVGEKEVKIQKQDFREFFFS